MSEEREKRIKALLELRDILKKRVKRLNEEVERLSKIIEVIDDILVRETVVTADLMKKPEGKRIEIKDSKNRIIGSIIYDEVNRLIRFEPGEVEISSDKKPIKSWIEGELRSVKNEFPEMEYSINSSDGKLVSIEIRRFPRDRGFELIRKIRWAVTHALA
ncbi:MAG: hypothetical protein ACP5KE_06320 [Candidatus Methanodesulfokora sp.]|nr:MAG: hypothetical protein C0200_07070 [Candidatus Korarchaeota archaeon]